MLTVLFAAPVPAASQGTEGIIRGRVLDQGFEPLSGVQVEIVDLARSATTAGDGTFRIEEVPAGRYVVRAETETRGTAVERIVVAPGQEVEVTLELNPAFHLDQLVVTASPTARTQEELFQAARALSGRELRSRVESSLGETVANEPGVNASFFGPASSRPIIRGLGGDRVRVLESGIGTGDASNTSPDHAVSVETQSAERIEIVRGPATLLYGSSAIGGVVNVMDGRIPDEVPPEGIRGELRAQGGTVADEGVISGELGAGLGSWAFHGSGVYRDAESYEIPGAAEEVHAGEPVDPDAPVGLVPNTGLETSRFAGGASWVGTGGYFGVSYSGYDSDYGVPGHHHEEPAPSPGPAPEEEPVSIDMEQRRVDARGQWRFGGLLRAVRARLGVSDYEHVELEGSIPGTRFTNDQWEGRLEVQHGLLGLEGAAGIQLLNRDFAAIGEEAFVPPNTTDLFGLFLFEEADLGDVSVQLGGRFEHQESAEQTGGFETDYQGLSASAGVNWQTSDALSLALSLSRSVKLPTAEELFSDGPHAATQAFEIGDRSLTEEVGWSTDATVHVHGEGVEAQLTGFVTTFDDFIFQRFTGTEQDGLPVLQYDQADALFTGFEAQADVELLHRGTSHLVAELWSDYVRAELTGPNEPLPRIPPLRVGAGLRYEGPPWNGAVRVRRVTEQDRVAAFEEPTHGYTMVEAEVGYRLLLDGWLHEVVLQGRNLTNAEARNHVSLLKELAPLPGRDFRLLYRMSF
ncbi:MAG: TonB-dependent receptor [Longimicrobiales bacterium]|nr:TonB-dependent receptor [Longimicrobiales bacterium]